MRRLESAAGGLPPPSGEVEAGGAARTMQVATAASAVAAAGRVGRPGRTSPPARSEPEDERPREAASDAIREDDAVRMAMPVFDATTRPADGVREALAWAVAEVEAAIEPHGVDEFRFLRSKRELHVRRGSSTVSVYFSGSKWNGTGHGIWLHRGMAIRDSRLGQWRRAHPAKAGDSDDFLDHVALDLHGETVVWQPRGSAPHPFADHELAELPGVVLRSVLDAFATYAEPLAAVRAVPADHLTALNVSAFAEWARAEDRPDEAAEVIRVALRRRPILDEYLPAVASRLGVGADLVLGGQEPDGA